MKLIYEASPHYRAPQSTSGIMKDLTMCLCAVTVFAIIYYSMVFGAAYGLRIVAMMATAIVCACGTEALFFKATKKDIKTGILTSYPWVTAMILVLISSVDNSCYAIGISTIIAIFFGKLAFGGFGQNIFNPAAFGEAILMNGFATSKSADFATGATPTTAIKSYGWLMSNEAFGEFIEKFGGLGKMFLGQYPSTIGSTCAMLILICCIYLIIRQDIDWQAPVFYIGTVLVVALIIGALHGEGAWYAAFQVLAGGVVFGGVFMMTDPVTSPVTIPGRIIFGVGAACFTLIFRLKSNMADGVLYSILLMNMLTPAIDKLMNGNQIKDARRLAMTAAVASGVFVIIACLIGASAKAKVPESASKSKAGSDAAAATVLSLKDDYSAYKAVCQETSKDSKTAVYACSAEGFGLVNGMSGEYKNNELDVTVDLAGQKVSSVKLVTFGDTAGVGDAAVTDSALAAYTGVTLNDGVDATTSATFTSKSVAAMIQAALNAAAGN